MASYAQKNSGYLVPDNGELDNVGMIMVCFCIPDHPLIRLAVRGAITELGYWKQWERRNDGNAMLAIEVADIMRTSIWDSLKMGNECCEFLQACLLPSIEAIVAEQSIAAEKWALDELLRYLDGLYDDSGNPDTIAPTMVFDDTFEDIFRNNVMCFATQILVQGLLQAEIDRREREAELWDASGEFLTSLATVVLGIGAALALPGLGWAALGFALASLYTEFRELWADMSMSELQDNDAALDVACCMYSNLADNTPTQAKFEASLSGCGLTGTAEKMRLAIVGFLSNIDVLLSFWQACEDLYPLAETGVLDECLCVLAQCSTYNFVAHDEQSWFAYDDGSDVRAEYIDDVGWTTLDRSDRIDIIRAMVRTIEYVDWWTDNPLPAGTSLVFYERDPFENNTQFYITDVSGQSTGHEIISPSVTLPHRILVELRNNTNPLTGYHLQYISLCAN